MVVVLYGFIVYKLLFNEEPVFDKAINAFSNSVISDEFSLNCSKLKRQSNVSFFSQQDSRQLKRMKFSKKI